MCLHLCSTLLQYNSFICYSIFISSKVLPGTRVIFSFLSLTQSLIFRDAKHEKNLVFVGQEMLNCSSNTVIQLNSPVLRHPERMILWKWGIEFLFVLFYNEQHKYFLGNLQGSINWCLLIYLKSLKKRHYVITKYYYSSFKVWALFLISQVEHFVCFSAG